jgi:hypothetical protein
LVKVPRRVSTSGVADAATIRTDENRRIGLEVEESNEDGSRL